MPDSARSVKTKPTRPAKAKAAQARKPDAPEPLRLEAFEVYSGHWLTFDGCIVCEMYGKQPVRVIAWAQSRGSLMPVDDEAAIEKDRLAMVKVARKAARDPSYISRSRSLLDYRQYGLPDSEYRMPENVYHWYLYPVGGRQNELSKSISIFPYCPFRFEEMLAARCHMIMRTGGDAPAGEMGLSGKITAYPWTEAAFQASKKRGGRQ